MCMSYYSSSVSVGRARWRSLRRSASAACKSTPLLFAVKFDSKYGVHEPCGLGGASNISTSLPAQRFLFSFYCFSTVKMSKLVMRATPRFFDSRSALRKSPIKAQSISTFKTIFFPGSRSTIS